MINHSISQGVGIAGVNTYSVKDKAKDPLQALKLNIPLSIVIVK